MRRAAIVVAALAVLGASVLLWFEVRDRLARGPAPTAAEIEELVGKRAALRDQLRALLSEKDILDAANVPAGNVVVGVPTAFAEDLVGQAARGVFSEVRLHLTGIRASHEGDVSAKVVFNQTVGHYTLDVEVKHIRALLKPGNALLEFGGDRIRIRLPVTVAEGRGTGNVRFRWTGKGLAGAICGDADVSPDVSSDVAPATYTVEGEFLLAAEGDSVVARPRFAEVALRLLLKPTEATWATLESTVTDLKEDKNGVCAMAIRRLDVRSLVEKVLGKGIPVKLPTRLLGALTLPAAVEQSLQVGGRTLTLDAKPIALHVTPRMIWYGAALSAEASR